LPPFQDETFQAYFLSDPGFPSTWFFFLSATSASSLKALFLVSKTSLPQGRRAPLRHPPRYPFPSKGVLSFAQLVFQCCDRGWRPQQFPLFPLLTLFLVAVVAPPLDRNRRFFRRLRSAFLTLTRGGFFISMPVSFTRRCRSSFFFFFPPRTSISPSRFVCPRGVVVSLG